MNRRYLTDDLEWPPEIPEPTLSVSEIEVVLDDLELNFSSTGKQKILNSLRAYKLDFYNENHKLTKNEHLEELKKMLEKTEKFNEELFTFSHTCSSSYTDTPPELSVARNAISNLYDAFNKRVKFLKIKGQGKSGGAPPKVALKRLIQRLIVIYKDETRENYVLDPGTNWGRTRNLNNPIIINYLSKVIALIDSEAAKDLSEKLKTILKNKYRPDIDLS